MPALTQELRLAIGKHKQTALQTALVAADCVSLRQTNRDIPQPQLISESDKDDVGKDVYASELFKSHSDATFPVNGYLSSEWAAILVAFGLGNTDEEAADDGFKYTSITPDLITDGLDMPATTIVAAIRQGTDTFVTDKALIGMCLEEFGFQFAGGPGRQNSQFTSQWVGSGKWASPSTITIPTLTTEHLLNSGGMSACLINGVDYFATHRFVSANVSWKNNIRTESAYYPGSGSESGFQIKGRMRRGSPQPSLSMVVECEHGSSEEDNLLNQTIGTASIIIGGAVIGGGPSINKLTITAHKIVPKVTQIGDSDGIASYSVDFELLKHDSNGVITFEVITSITGVLTSA